MAAQLPLRRGSLLLLQLLPLGKLHRPGLGGRLRATVAAWLLDRPATPPPPSVGCVLGPTAHAGSPSVVSIISPAAAAASWVPCDMLTAAASAAGASLAQISAIHSTSTPFSSSLALTYVR